MTDEACAEHPALTELSEEEQLLKQTAYDFAVEQVAPRSAHMEAQARIDPEIVSALFDLGLMGVEVPERYSGAGASFFGAVLVVEALARADASVSVLVDVQNTLVQNTVLRCGSDEQKERYLPQLSTSWVGSYALSEESSGSDAFALKTTATKTQGGYRLSGSKLWITNAAESELFIVFATEDPSAGYKGISAFLVERGMD